MSGAVIAVDIAQTFECLLVLEGRVTTPRAWFVGKCLNASCDEIRGPLALNQVHQVQQAVFGWEYLHLHRYTTDEPFAPLQPVGGVIPEVLQWLPGQECEEPGDRPEEEFSLDQLFGQGSGAVFYEYDFGDSWLHRLELVSRRPASEDTPLARLIDGARRGPPEDSGGLPGYEEIMDA